LVMASCHSGRIDFEKSVSTQLYHRDRIKTLS
jgi:hypothetical protein